MIGMVDVTKIGFNQVRALLEGGNTQLLPWLFLFPTVVDGDLKDHRQDLVLWLQLTLPGGRGCHPS